MESNQNTIQSSLESDWLRTNTHLDWLNREFITLHQTNQKDWTKEQQEYAKNLRKSCIETLEWRYWILSEIKKYDKHSSKDSNQS